MVESSLSKRARGLASIGLTLGAVFLAGCGGPGDTSSGAPSLTDDSPPGAFAGASSDEAPVGSVTLELDVAGAHLATAGYTIIGPKLSITGSFDVSQSTRISGIVAGLPFGTGYVVTLTAQSSDKPVLNCSGSAAFAVSSSALVPVTVPVACRAEKDAPLDAVAAPIPPLAPALLFLVLLGLGTGLHWRAARRRVCNS
jgi:hypothetical protein